MKNWEGTTTTLTGVTVKLPYISLRCAVKATLAFWGSFFKRGPLIFNCDEVILHIPPPPRKETHEQD